MMHIELLLAALGGLLLVAFVAWWLYRRHQRLLAYLQSQGWQLTTSLPEWLSTESIPRLASGAYSNVRYRKVISGSASGLPVCGFERHRRSTRSRTEPTRQVFLCLRDPGLSEELPDFQLAHANPLANALASVADGVAAVNESQFRLQSGLTGFDAWRVHATTAGRDWLTSATGQRLGAVLTRFDARAYHAFGASGKIVYAEGIDLTADRLASLWEDLKGFHTLLTTAIAPQAP